MSARGLIVRTAMSLTLTLTPPQVDNWKHLSAIEVYDGRHRPMLDHYRSSLAAEARLLTRVGLRVPKIRALIEICSFTFMTFLFTVREARHATELMRCSFAMCVARLKPEVCCSERPPGSQRLLLLA